MLFKKFGFLTFLLNAVLVTGCVSVKHTPLTIAGSEALQNASVTKTHYPTPDFTAMTAGKASFALVGAAAMISAGNKIVKENNIPDPAVTIGEGLLKRMVESRHVAVVPAKQNLVQKDDVKTLVANNKHADYLLDIKTINWMFSYYPTDWTHYRVIYNARLRLIDTKAGKVIAETMCQTVQGDDKNPPTHDQLLDNNASLLKDYLTKGAIQCVDVLAKDVLRL